MMKGINRRKFLLIAGAAGGAAAAGVGGTAVTLLAKGGTQHNMMAFRAVAGLPAKGLPAYCSYVLEGHVDVTAKTGVVTKTMYAGAPEIISNTVWPGFAQTIHITNVQQNGSVLRITGVVSDPSQLKYGESANVEIVVDHSSKTVQAPLLGTLTTMTLE